jgi:hypothetical protein
MPCRSARSMEAGSVNDEDGEPWQCDRHMSRFERQVASRGARCLAAARRRAHGTGAEQKAGAGVGPG